jgi:hypothetical protein
MLIISHLEKKSRYDYPNQEKNEIRIGQIAVS